MAASLNIGDRLSYDGAVCTIRYIGQIPNTTGTWLGVEWDDASRGKHDGSHKGTRYFTCKSTSPTAGSFIRPTRPAETPNSFLSALHYKYASEGTEAPGKDKTSTLVWFSTKVAEEVGFEKIRRKQSQLSELKVVILDGMRIAAASNEGDARIHDVCPKIIELCLSRNLFGQISPVVDVCSELPALCNLRLNGNRFREILKDESLQRAGEAFAHVTDLALDETLLSWEEICAISTRFPTLTHLSASTNQLTRLGPATLSNLTSTLTSLNLEFNEFTTLGDLASLTALRSLRNLHLKGNNIDSIMATGDREPARFSQNLQYLDISYNKVKTWGFIDDLPACFPGLTSLRFAHNPIYDNPDPEFSVQVKNVTEEAFMIAVARLASLKALNFGTITPTDRQDAEMFYLARVAKHLAAVPETEEAEVLKHHSRYAELCELYGAPMINRRKEVNPNFLEARLITVRFVLRPGLVPQVEALEKIYQIPKSFDIYHVKGIVGKLFGLSPLKLRLIWETGEWDPVAGFDDEAEDSEEEEEEEQEQGNGKEEPTQEMDAEVTAEDAADAGRRTGKWVRREVELHDGPRQLGFCVDGLEAVVRVETR